MLVNTKLKIFLAFLIKENSSFFLGFFLLLLTSCNFTGINIKFLAGDSFSKTIHLKIEEKENISVSGPSENVPGNFYSCDYEYRNQKKLKCEDLNQFSFDTDNGGFDWIPNYQHHGKYIFSIHSNNGKTKVIVIEVSKKNEAPIIKIPPVLRLIEEGQTYQLNVEVSDVNSDPLKVHYECLSSNCQKLENINYNKELGIFSFNTHYESAGHYKVGFVVSDIEYEIKSEIEFEVVNTNRAPIASSMKSVELQEGEEWFGLLNAEDPDGDEINYHCQSCPTGFLVGANDGVLSWTPSWSQAGSYDIEIAVSDGFLNTVVSFIIKVHDLNRAPVLTSIGNKIINENENLIINLAALDPDNDSLTYSFDCSTCPAEVSLVGNVFSWTPNYQSSGVYSVTFKVEDNGMNTLSDTETITITVNDVNRPPVLNNIANQTIDEFKSIAQIDVNDGVDDFDIDGDKITYTCFFDNTVGAIVSEAQKCSTLIGLDFDSETGILNWQTAEGSANSYEFKIVGTDGKLKDEKIFSITVSPVFPMILTFKTTGNNETIEIPTDNRYTYDYQVSWGDGSPLQSVTTAVLQSHTYAIAGEYQVKIYGKFPSIKYGGLSGVMQAKLVEVNDLGRTGLVDLRTSFSGCSGLRKFSVGNGDTSNITDMNAMFYKATGLVELDLRELKTNNVTNMQNMFYGMTNLVSLDLSTFDTGKVTSMNAMFRGMSKLESLDVSSFNTSRVTDMSYMFENMAVLKRLDLASFDTSRVTNMGNMFGSLRALEYLNVSSFNTSNVTSMMSMFVALNKLTELDVTSFDTSKVAIMTGMFSGCTQITNLDVSKFNTSNVTAMGSMFAAISKVTALDLTKFDTRKVTNMSGMFDSAIALTSLDLSSFDTTNVTSMNKMFNRTSGLTELDLSNFNTAKVTNLSYMFSDANKIKNLNLSSFNTSLVNDMSYMFNNASSITDLDLTNFDTSKVTNMGYMFYGNSGLLNLNLSSFKTPILTNMGFMFYGATKLETLDLSSFDTSNVTSMGAVFSQMFALKNLNISSFNTSKVMAMGSMFSRNHSLASLDLHHFDTSNVLGMSNMFYEMTSLTTLDLSSFNTSKVMDMYAMFYGASGLRTINLSSFSTANVQTMYDMFNGASSLEELNLSNFNVSNVKRMERMFSNTTSLADLNLSNWVLNNLVPTGTDALKNTNPTINVSCMQDPIGNFLKITCQ